MSIRLRLAAVFTVAAALLFTIGAWLFDSQLSSGMIANTDAQLKTALASTGAYIGANLQGGSGEKANASPIPGEFLIQLIDSSGKVRGASADAGTTPLVPAALLDKARRRTVAFTSVSEGETTRTLAAPYPRHPGWVAVANVSLESYVRARSDLFRELVIAGIVFLAIAGFGSYVLARAALSPVERLRRQVAAISERDEEATVEVPRTKDEIAALAETMNAILLKLRSALVRQRNFVADASHELRTPFAVLRGELELAGRPGRSREELTEAIASASEEAERLNRLTEDLLTLARSDDNQLAVRSTPTDVLELLERSAAHARGRAAASGVDISVEVTPGLVADVDPDRVRQAFDNLIDNALRFAPRDTAIVLRARATRLSGGVTIEVEDEGPGFPPEFLPHAFERFRRPDSGRTRSDGGAGLGLAIVSAVVRAHGGQR